MLKKIKDNENEIPSQRYQFFKKIITMKESYTQTHKQN